MDIGLSIIYQAGTKHCADVKAEMRETVVAAVISFKFGPTDLNFIIK